MLVLLARADLVKFELTSGDLVQTPRGFALVHDATGEHFSRCDLYVIPCRCRRKKVVNLPAPMSRIARDYFGEDTYLCQGVVDIPQTTWHRVGQVETIYYRRRGNERGLYHHRFKTKVELYAAKNGKAWRLVLPDACVVNERGFVWP